MPLQAVKRALLPRGARPRRLPFGLAAGAVMTIDFAHQTRLFLGLYERELMPHMRRLVARGMRAFDVGANVGYYSLALARLSGGPVIAFEPMADALAQVTADAARNGFDVRPHRALIGAADGDGMITLDAAADAYFAPDVIKMDIEGHELAALEGARRLLATRRPHLVLEVHSEQLERDCDRLLREHGYLPRAVRPRSFLPEERPDAGNAWLVCEGRAP